VSTHRIPRTCYRQHHMWSIYESGALCIFHLGSSVVSPPLSHSVTRVWSFDCCRQLQLWSAVPIKVPVVLLQCCLAARPCWIPDSSTTAQTFEAIQASLGMGLLPALAVLLCVVGAQGSFEVEVAGLKVGSELVVVPWSNAAACVAPAAGMLKRLSCPDLYADCAPF
jgi:hypothetical protein